MKDWVLYLEMFVVFTRTHTGRETKIPKELK